MSDTSADPGTTEEEVTFEEEVDRDSLTGQGPLPSYHYSPWLLLLPLLCALALAWNVRWRNPRVAPRRSAARESTP